ncbi:MAG: type II toxin-antitoxin system VapC family toxin [Candidatus Poribacteria bacterium]|nr:type II toxin-antitoxin system VapC family toxin [Candidatus Poribacteria bacterium]
MLLDSNIIIYAAQPEHRHLRSFIARYAPAVSAISYVEVLGYHRLSNQDRHYFRRFFQVASVLSISEVVLEKAVALRQQRRMTLGDAIIAGTALAHGLTLVTRNTEDFQWIDELSVINPFEAGNL